MPKIERFGSVASTNDIAAERALGGADEWTVILASSQTCGRGRMGRKFVSEEGCGLYMSVVLRPKFSAENALLITTAAATAVAETVEKYTGRDAGIKWVNDVYLDGKKVAGILTEGRVTGDTLEHAILGIGINLSEPEGGFDESIRDIAGALFSHGDAPDEETVALDVLKAFAEYYDRLTDKPHYDGYCRRSILCGKDVDIICGGEKRGEGRVLGVAEDFSLRISTENGEELVSTGEVSVRAK